MPGYMLHMGATVICSHGGQAMPTMPNPRVKVGSQPIVTQPTMYTVAGCPFVSGSNPLPCVTASWVSAAVRVKAGGVPVLLQDSQAITTPNGVPLNVLVTQVRVKGM
jgi:hypothetical protein